MPSRGPCRVWWCSTTLAAAPWQVVGTTALIIGDSHDEELTEMHRPGGQGTESMGSRAL
jgi:hypothetical protein